MDFSDDSLPASRTLKVDGSNHAAVFQSVIPAVRQLHYISHNLENLLSLPRVAIVGTRKVTPYGRQVTIQFASELAKQGIVIVSGLAYGVDAIAHQAALDVGGLTVAVLPGPVEAIYPTRHCNLAARIVKQGGALISEYPAGSGIAYKNQFVERNRIVSGMSNALLITEAAINSGTMHTANFALEQGIDVFAVPGNITSPSSVGTNNLLRKPQALVASSPGDILAALGLSQSMPSHAIRTASPNEQLLLNLLSEDIHDGDELLFRSKLSTTGFNQVLTMMEITGKIRALGANQWGIT